MQKSRPLKRVRSRRARPSSRTHNAARSASGVGRNNGRRERIDGNERGSIST
jgi:hypothetical protein